jgi:hypothetical protein
VREKKVTSSATSARAPSQRQIGSFFNNHNKDSAPNPSRDCLIQFWGFVDMFGIAIDVAGDGNCGYYVLQKGLERIGKCCPTSITMFRKDLYDFASLHSTFFMQRMALQFRTEEKRKKWWQGVLQKIFEPDQTYECGTGFDSWFDPNYLLPIALRKYDLSTITVYESGDAMNPNNSIVVTAIEQAEGYSIARNYTGLTRPDSATIENSILMIHTSGVHYQWLKPHPHH